jgi:hypothetical protein
MQSILSIEQSILASLRQLPPEKQQQVLSFARSLQQSDRELPPQWHSLREIAAMPTTQRHELLSQYIPAMVQDFLDDPELTEFAVLDAEDLDCDL